MVKSTFVSKAFCCFGAILMSLALSVQANAADPASSQIAQNADEITVTGVVLDTDGLSVIGASVVIEGTTTGAITDLDGNFTITALGVDSL